jgi:hypothetical protein
MVDALATEFTVTVDGDQYVFKIPTIKYTMEMGARATDIRRRAYPTTEGDITRTDYIAVLFSRACAQLELYLVRASVAWPYGFDDTTQIDPNTPPVVDFEKFPFWATDTIERIGEAFNNEVERFRSRRNPNKRPDGTEAVARVENSGSS